MQAKDGRRAFVLQVSGDQPPPPGELRGRILHLSTSDGGNFDSVESLLAIIRRILSESPPTPSQDDGIKK